MMDDFTAEMLAQTGGLAADSHTDADREDDHHSEPGPPKRAAAAAAAAAPTAKRGRGFRAFLKTASLQDQLLDKLLQQVMPFDDAAAAAGVADAGADTPGDSGSGTGTGTGTGTGLADPADEGLASYDAARPNFSVATMSNNFRRFNARIGVVFRFQARALRLLAWRRASHTLAFLAVYTLVCLDPYLLTVLPPAFLLLGALVPGFVARHPAPPSPGLPVPLSPANAFSPRGPPLAPARTVKPVKELSRDFFRNMRDLQNSMEDFSVAHDRVVGAVVPLTNFSDEALSSAVFVALCAAALFMSVAAHLLPWRLLFLAAGWVVTWSGHPAVARALRSGVGAGGPGNVPRTAAAALPRAASAWQSWVTSDIILDEAPETREVEIFELQRRSAPASAEWEPWVFSPSPYDPLSAPRIARERPRGTRFFEDVLPPEGWEWSEKKWALDLWSREWVEERIITGVEVETEGERWVYDIYNEHEAAADAAAAAGAGVGFAEPAGGAGPVLETPTPPPYRGRPGGSSNLSWEEGEEGMGRRGEWRRRRWVRLVKRKKITTPAA